LFAPVFYYQREVTQGVSVSGFTGVHDPTELFVGSLFVAYPWSLGALAIKSKLCLKLQDQFALGISIGAQDIFELIRLAHRAHRAA
jgi:hypothetical protein